MERIKYNRERFKLMNVVYIENIPNIYLQKDFLFEQLSQYGKIRKININKFNKIHLEFYSNFSAFLCTKYINNFKLLIKEYYDYWIKKSI